jgi:hypothetical protein
MPFYLLVNEAVTHETKRRRVLWKTTEMEYMLLERPFSPKFFCLLNLSKQSLDSSLKWTNTFFVYNTLIRRTAVQLKSIVKQNQLTNPQPSIR